jgi:hypothetical protein
MRNSRATTVRDGRLARLAAAMTVFGAIACGDPAGPAAPRAGASASGYYNNFYNVQVQPEGLAINVYFQYLGKESPILSLGKTSDIYNSLVTWVPAKNMNNGYWLARIANLKPGTLYYYRLDDLQSTWSGSVKTLRRRLIIDVDSMHVFYDGDAGIAGCGEMITRVNYKWFPSGTHALYHTKWHCLNSGANLVLSDEEGRWTFDDVDQEHILVHLEVFEEDSCGYWSPYCGDIAVAAASLYYDTMGGSKSYVFKVGTLPSHTPSVRWAGTVKTTFVP